MSNDNQPHEKSIGEKKRNDWIISIKNMLATVEMPSRLSIYKVPKKLLKLKEEAYTPSIVSIGPFHHNNKAVLAFEEHKRQYMVHLFMRISQAEKSLKECAVAILELEEEARRCYSEKIDLDKYELAEILLVDGCFLLELFLKYSNIENHEEGTVEDPLINKAQNIATLQHDLALLENQIPFPVLETLFDIIKGHVPQPLQSSFTEHNVATLALLFFKSALGLKNEAIQSKSSNISGKHLLDILHNFYVPTTVKSPEKLVIFELRKSDKIPESRNLQRSGFRDCAAKLLKAGISFSPTVDANKNLLDISFSATDRVVTMPPLHIEEDITKTIFRNLIAFEQCDRIDSTSHHIASYVFLMRSLVHSSHGVGILHKAGIIKDDFRDGEDVTSLFDSLCDGIVLNDSYFSELCEDVNKYYYNGMSLWQWSRLNLILEDSWRKTKDKWRGYMLDLFSVYLKNPWTTLKVIAAVLVLIFTALQTGYAIRSYYK